MKKILFLTVLLFSIAFSSTAQVSFAITGLQGTSLNNPTSVQFGPDGRLYVSQQNGQIHAYTIVRNGANDYEVTATEYINEINNIVNHNDDGSVNSSITNRQVTGIYVTGTAAAPVIYVSSSDPRIAVGYKSGLDTNSGMISRLDWDGTKWVRTDLVRGLPRSEENHSTNGMVLDKATNTLYVAQGGNTNMGAPSNNFAYAPEYALAASVLSIDLDAIGNSTYDLPTLDDEDRSDVANPSPGYTDQNDPFGGNSGKNMAMWKVGSPVQVYAGGFRNPYDVVLTKDGKLYTFDNGPNGGWGDVPVNCSLDPNEPGVSYPDGLHYINQEGYYGGHPTVVRGNYNLHFNLTDPQHAVDSALINPDECTYLVPGSQNGALVTINTSTNGLTEYTASNMNGELQGELIAAGFNGNLYRVKLNAAGDALAPGGLNVLASNFGSTPLDVTAQGDSAVFPGTVWAATYGANQITILEPNDYSGPSVPCNPIDPNDDSDADGYTNADELANGTDPCNPADKPADFDGDLLSNLLDADDDGDGIPDTSDIYALDADNGVSTQMPYRLDFDNSDDGGIQGWGFTGMMNNGSDNYQDQYDINNMTVGGAALKFTIGQIQPTDAYSDWNTQEYGFQFGVNTSNEQGAFTVQARLEAPFSGLTPQDYQSYGMFIGTGDQSNYLKFVANAQGGAGGLQLLYEENDGGANGAVDPDAYDFPITSVLSADYVDVYLTIDPQTLEVQPYYSIDGAPKVALGTPISIPASWLSNVLACGFISSSNNASPYPATWDYIDIYRERITAAGNWEDKVHTNSCTERHENAFVQVGDKFYLLGGRGNRPVEIFNPADSTWAVGAAMPFEMNHFQAIEYGGLIYVMGAFKGSYPSETPVENIYIYNPVTDSWSVGPEIPQARRRGSAGVVVYNEKIYMVGGIQNGHQSGWVNWLDQYDPKTNQWQTLPNAPLARDHFHAAVVNGKLYLAGGRRTNFDGDVFGSMVGQVDVYNFGNQTWTTVSGQDIPTPRGGTTVGVIGDELIVIGGESNTQTVAHDEVEAFNVQFQQWRSLTPLNTGRHGTQAITNNGNIYIQAGSGNRGGGPELCSPEQYYLYESKPILGDAVQPSDLLSSADTIDFGKINVGNSDAETITLSNANGNQGILITEALLNSTEFNLFSPYDLPFLLMPGEEVELTVEFFPNSGSLVSENLSLITTASNDTLEIVVIGESDPINSLYKINCGGTDYSTVGGETFQTDMYFSGGSIYNIGNAIGGTQDDQLYQDERYGQAFAYDFPVLNGNYQVVLHFAEIYWNNPGQRVFDVTIEGDVLLDNYDILVNTAKNTSTVEVFNVQVNDGALNIAFDAITDNAKISAIEINEGDTSQTGGLMVWYADNDGDGFGNVADTVMTAIAPNGYSADSTDCDDTNAAVYPGAEEIPNGKDDDCDGIVDNGIYDVLYSDLNINCGGGDYIAASGDTFVADDFFYFTSQNYINTQATTNTNDSDLYLTERFGQLFSYRVPVESGDYLVVLQYAENFWSNANQRLFNVALQGDTVRNNLDLFVEAGQNLALRDSFYITVADSLIDINFKANTDNAKISAIQIQQLTSINSAPSFALSTDSLIETQDFSGSLNLTVNPNPVPVDEQSQVVTYSISPSSVAFANMNFDSNTGAVEFTAAPGSYGVQTFTITADDGQAVNATYSKDFVLRIDALPSALNALRINCGGPAYTAANGDEFDADAYFTGNGNATSWLSVTGTTDPELYKTTRSGWGSSMTYSIPVDPGQYSLKLHFIENYWGATQKRVFGFTAEGTTLETNLDIFDEAGKGFALLKNYNNILVTDSVLNLNFKSITNVAMIAAIEVIPQGGSFNTAPTFSVSGDLLLQENFSGTETVSVTPDPVPAADTAQVVTYSLDPPSVTFADVQFDTTTGQVDVTSLPGKYGSQTFVITADDGESYNNAHSETFVLEVESSQIPNTPPTFSLSGDVTVLQDFQGTETVTVTPDDVNDTATYSISPSSVGFANINFDSNTGEVNITSAAGAFGSQTFTITADDGELNDNLHSETFTLTVIQSGGGGSVLRINSGGDAFVNSLGQYFMADSFYTGTGLAYSWGPVSGTDDQELYRYGRHGWGTTLGYNVPLAADTYTVILHFAETHFQSVGSRIFNVSVEGDQVINNLDIYAEAGYRNAYPVTLSDVEVSDGELNIQFSSVANVAQIQGIEIIGNGSGYVAPTPNTAPSFSLSGDVTVQQDFATTETVTVSPDPVPASDTGQVVTYSLSPASVAFANISFDSNTGNVTIDSVTGQSGTQVFTITADDGQATNNIHSESFTLTVEPNIVPGSAIRINCGGPAYTASNGHLFSADQYYLAGSVSTTWKPIFGTSDETLYQTDRYSWGSNLKYEIPVAVNDTYTVRLHFAEFFWQEDGKRVEDVFVEGDLRLPDYDIHADVGYSNAVIKEYTDVIVTDGVLNIDFSTKVYLSKVSAIEVYATGSGGGINKLAYEVTSIDERADALASMSNVYPNPGKNFFMMELENNYQGKLSLEVFDMLGKQHQQLEFEKSDFYLKKQIDASNLPAGLYIIHMKGEDFEWTEKWQKL